MKILGIFSVVVLFCQMAQARLVIDDGLGEKSPSQYDVEINQDGVTLSYLDKSLLFPRQSLSNMGYNSGLFQNLLSQARMSDQIEVMVDVINYEAILGGGVQVADFTIKVKHF